MHATRWLLALALLAPVLCGQTPAGAVPGRTWYIPALGYGPDAWSIVRIANPAATRRTAQVDVYRQSGERMPLPSTVEVEPGASVDVRIEGKSATGEVCWARVAEMHDDPATPDLEVHGFVEILAGNAIADFAREPHRLMPEGHWASPASRVDGKLLYFLNVAGTPTIVSFCAANQAPPAVCQKPGNHTSRYLLKSNQSISVQVRKLRRKYFVVESASPSEAILVMFEDAPGTRRVFSSKSSIEYGGAVP